MTLRVPYYHQKTEYTCGPASLKMVLSYFHVVHSEKYLSRRLRTNKDIGSRHLMMRKAAVKQGFYCYVNDEALWEELEYFIRRKLPVIVNYVESDTNESHYAVVSGVSPKRIILADPWLGKDFRLSKLSFLKRWHSQNNDHRHWLMVISLEDIRLGKQYLSKK